MIRTVRRGIAALAAAGVLAGLAGPALADVKAGVDAWAKGDFATAVREWKGPADAGDPDAQFNLGQAYKLGRGVPRDMAKAEALYASAAGKGHLQASDNYGLVLFQRGERAKAMPYIRSAASRGDARAQYILSLALFNGDGMPKDWVRAYAYATVAQQAGLPQAAGALAQMDQHVPMADRQKSVALAAQIAAEAEATRARQLAAVDLGGLPGRSVVGDGEAGAAPAARGRGPSVAVAERAAADAARAAGSAARSPRAPAPAPSAPSPASTPPRAAPARGAPARSAPAPSTVAPSPPRSASSASSPSRAWRLQLGAFGVAGNAEALWARVKSRPELAGRGKLLVRAGKLTKLQVGGFASQAEASGACARLKSSGFACLATRD